jgi:hypothetical protein
MLFSKACQHIYMLMHVSLLIKEIKDTCLFPDLGIEPMHNKEQRDMHVFSQGRGGGTIYLYTYCFTLVSEYVDV